MDAYVQLIRNFLCCCKDLNLFEGTLLHDAVHTRHWLGDLPDPLDQTTPLEVLISITQLYACLSCTRSGWKLMTTSVGKLRRIVRLVEQRLNNPKALTHADRIVNESLFKEAKYAVRSAFIGFLVFPLGIAFFWLFANSWHVTQTDWIGGLPALIHALTVMEIALAPLLYFMIVDGFEMLAKSKRCQELFQVIDQGTLSPAEIGIHRYESMTGWLPFWDSGTGVFAKASPDEAKKVQDEVKQVQATLDAWFPKDTKKNEKEDKISKAAFDEAKEKLEAAVPKLRFEGYREFLYFVFNFVAFYGYLMGVMVYYYDNEEEQPYHVRSLKFFYSNNDADWTGNFAGDLMWTLEPMVILGSPFLIQLAKPKSKVKAD